MTFPELEEAKTNLEKPPICVLDASSYVGFHILEELLHRGYNVHAAVQSNGKGEVVRRIEEMSGLDERLVVFGVDFLDYHSILVALKSCCALFCCLDSSDGYDEGMVDMEVRGVINVVEACAQTDSVQKMVFTSSLTAGIWRENICLEKDVDERSWSDAEFCRKMKLWYALAKTQSERAAWALAMDRMVNMVSINAALVLGPCVVHQNPTSTMSYLKGAAQMCERGVLAIVDVNFLVDCHIRAFENRSACGRFFCYNQVMRTDEDAIKLAESLSPLISMPARYECKAVVYEERLRKEKLNRLIEGAA
ncbi:cinnamoyl-CoA reductase-like SNL6 [Magnolia sinica]|uniref:cinnamoyl-CoA reductase-like SNL6 n=1 Tax=Magnolia sinica TaxID=86752 RepID=UPI00265AB195|nr:cinnamoyl-CoA reductase-like SNL6 [Magnolia sinica]